jgi:hypothetical protein
VQADRNLRAYTNNNVKMILGINIKKVNCGGVVIKLKGGIEKGVSRKWHKPTLNRFWR